MPSKRSSVLNRSPDRDRDDSGKWHDSSTAKNYTYYILHTRAHTYTHTRTQTQSQKMIDMLRKAQ